LQRLCEALYERGATRLRAAACLQKSCNVAWATASRGRFAGHSRGERQLQQVCGALYERRTMRLRAATRWRKVAT